jgi:glycosyltransferase involved in cell wall biosynthesis
VIGSLAIGGTERQLVEFIRRCTCPDQHLVAVFDSARHGDLADQLPRPPISLGRLGREVRSMPSNLKTMLALRRVVRKHRIDLVHAHLGASEVLAMVVPRNVPVVASRRGRNVGFEDHAFLKLVEGLGHRRTDLLLCNSRYLANYTRGEDLWPPPIEVIYNAVDLQRFRSTAMPPTDTPTVAMVANLKPYKGQKRFLQAFHLVAREIPGATALLVGGGPDRGRLTALASQLGINKVVTFVGQVEDPRPYVARSHIAALTSSHEGFPNAILEAMAMGRPVVATRVGGIPEMVRDGVDGLLTSLDPVDIATAIVKLLRDEALRTQMGAEARRRAEDFDWDRVVIKTEAAYQGVLRRRSRGSAR